MEKIVPKNRCPNCEMYCRLGWCKKWCAFSREFEERILMDEAAQERDNKARLNSIVRHTNGQEKRSVICVDVGAVFETPQLVTELLGFSAKNVRASCNKGFCTHGLYFVWTDFQEGAMPDTDQLSRMKKIIKDKLTANPYRKIFCHTTNQHFDSLFEAGERMDLPLVQIRRVLSGERKSYKGFTFEWEAPYGENAYQH